MAIFTHITVGTNDLGRATAFYDSVLEPLGVRRVMEMPDRLCLYGDQNPEFGVIRPANGEPATPANGGTISFAAPTRAAVHSFHERALAAGGLCEGPPGPRAFAPTAYAAYVRDLDGNKLCTYCFAPE